MGKRNNNTSVKQSLPGEKNKSGIKSSFQKKNKNKKNHTNKWFLQQTPHYEYEGFV